MKTKSKPFVHLHFHTGYSLLDGACRVKDTMETALENNMPAVAITDHGVMYGVIEFYQEAKKKGIKPIVGCEVYVTQGSRHDRGSTGQRTPLNHLVLLAKNETGYHNLVKLVSLSHLEGFYYKPRIDKEIMAKYSDGLIGLSACLKGEIAQKLNHDDIKGAISAAGWYADLLGKDSFYLEVQNHGMPEQARVNKRMKEVITKTGLKPVATNDVHYIKKEHAAAHEVLLCLQTQTFMSDPKRMRYPTNEFYMKTRTEMDALFTEFPGAVDITVDIADMCTFEMEFNTPHFPIFQLPPGKTQKEYLIEIGFDGLKKHYGIKNPKQPANDKERVVMERFHHELSVIEKTGFINYFLVVWDFVRFAHSKGIPVGPGRGSGGGSLIAYVLEITSIDPLRYDLIFERFLNPERVSPPDFDIDFCQSRRGEVIEYVKEKYGRDRVAQIVTFGSLGPKTVIRDVGRVLEIPLSYCDRLSKTVPDTPKITLDKVLADNPEFKRAYNNDEDCKKILEYALVLEGLQRNQGTHAAGVVIGEKPLIEIVPLAKDKNGEVITQYSMLPLGEIGMLKMDFLGLKTLTIIEETLALVERRTGKRPDLKNMGFDDKPTYDLLNKGDTVGVFQLEGSGMRDLIRRVDIDKIEDLIAMIALYRPGSMEWLDDYVNRKHGKESIVYLHKLMEPILKETYGIMIYQEQVQKVASVLAGYTPGQADILRRAIGKKMPEVIAQQRGPFVEGCAKTNRIKKELADKIFDLMAKFGGYGFNKSHSAAYAIIGYHTAYLKANHPEEFLSATLSSEMNNFEKIPVFIADARQSGLEILAPDVNESGVRFLPTEKAIRYGLAGIKNVGEGAAETIVREREKNGPYNSLIDFCMRIDGQLVNKKVVESLARCGAMDSFGMHRARIFNGVDFAMARASQAAKDRRSGQTSLFDLMSEKDRPTETDTLPDCEPWRENELLAAEKELLGHYVSGHPLTQYSLLLNHYQLTPVNKLAGLKSDSLTRVGGIISQVDKKFTKLKKPLAIIKLEGLDDVVEVVAFSEVLAKYAMHILPDTVVLVCGKVEIRDEKPQIQAYEIYPIADAPRHFADRVNIHISESLAASGKLNEISEIIGLHPGNVPVSLCLIMPAGEKVIMNTSGSFKVFPDESFISDVEKSLGANTVFISVKSAPCLNPPQKKFWRNGNGTPSKI